MAEILVPQDAIEVVAYWLIALRESGQFAELAGMSVSGEELKPGQTPTNLIRVSLVGSSELQRIGDRESVRVQIWKTGTNKERVNLARLIDGLARAKLAARKESGPVSLPDPATLGVQVTQIEFAIATIGRRL